MLFVLVPDTIGERPFCSVDRKARVVVFYRFLTLEVWSEERMEGWSRYYDHGADMPSNLAMMRHVTSNCAGRCLQRVVDTVLNHVPRDSWPNWAVSVGVMGGASRGW